MSGKAMGWALEQKTELPVDKLILIALGNFADETHQCFPSRRKLSDLAMCSLDTVDRAIKRLIDSGLVTKDSRLAARGGLSSNVYVLPVGDYADGKHKQHGAPSRNLRPPTEAAPSRNLRGGDSRNLPPTLAASGCGHPSRNRAATHEPLTEPSIEEVNPPTPLQGADPVELYEALVAEAPKSAAASPTPLACLRAFEAYNARALELGLPQASKLTPGRARSIGARLREFGPDGWTRAMINLDAPFLRGLDGKAFRADLDFVCQAKSFGRLHDGGYAPKPSSGVTHASDRFASANPYPSVRERAAAAAQRGLDAANAHFARLNGGG